MLPQRDGSLRQRVLIQTCRLTSKHCWSSKHSSKLRAAQTVGYKRNLKGRTP